MELEDFESNSWQQEMPQGRLMLSRLNWWKPFRCREPSSAFVQYSAMDILEHSSKLQ
jgi:hypothetical protein